MERKIYYCNKSEAFGNEGNRNNLTPIGEESIKMNNSHLDLKRVGFDGKLFHIIEALLPFFGIFDFKLKFNLKKILEQNQCHRLKRSDCNLGPTYT